MEALSYVVLILLSLVGYSGGAAARAGKSRDLKPDIADLILVVLIWAAAIYSRLAFDINRWVLILAWIGMAAVLGVVVVSFRKLPAKEGGDEDRAEGLSRGVFKRLWKRWAFFSKRMGSFQSRVMLSLFFFVFISPVAFLITLMGDPLKIKKRKNLETYWSPRAESSGGLEEFRRQF